MQVPNAVSPSEWQAASAAFLAEPGWFRRHDEYSAVSR